MARGHDVRDDSAAPAVPEAGAAQGAALREERDGEGAAGGCDEAVRRRCGVVRRRVGGGVQAAVGVLGVGGDVVEVLGGEGDGARGRGVGADFGAAGGVGGGDFIFWGGGVGTWMVGRGLRA